MTWILVLVTLTFHGHPIATEEGRFDTMNKCFHAREQLILDVGGDPATGHFPEGMQAICIPLDNK